MRGRRVDVRRLEQPELELDGQHARDGAVDERRVDAPVGERLRQRGAERGGRGQLDVDPGLERQGGGRPEVADDRVRLDQLVDPRVVGDDDPVEAPLVAQRGGEELARGDARHPVDVLVGVHHRAHPGLADGRLEGPQVDVAQLARTDVRRRAVHAALGQAVADHVLAGRQHRRAGALLQAADVGHAERGDQVGVLAVGLLDAPPARVARDVEDRRQPLVGAHRAQLAREAAWRAPRPAPDPTRPPGRSTAGSRPRRARRARAGTPRGRWPGCPGASPPRGSAGSRWPARRRRASRSSWRRPRA